MRSIFAKRKQLKEIHLHNTFRAKTGKKDAFNVAFAKRQKLKKKHEFGAVRTKNWKERCVESFAKRQNFKNMNLALFELKPGKKDTLNL